MADLDSFFAKKNKKKVKGKKFMNPDDIAKRLEEEEKRREKDLHKIEPKKLLDEVLVSVMNNPTAQSPKKEEEEEWKDFKDDREHDLTDLKLSKLQIDNDEDMYGGYGSGDDGERGSKGDQTEGVWGKAAATAAPVEVPTPAPAVVDSQTPVITQPTSYLPPHLRHAAGSSARVGHGRPKKSAPDITNEMAFPTLGDAPAAAAAAAAAANTPSNNRQRQRFSRHDDVRYENVKFGSTRVVESAAPRINTSNRFNALSDRS